MTDALTLHDLTHRYGDRVALRAVDASVPRCGLFALLGPNGSGKSTLFKIVSTLVQPDLGQVWVGGCDVRTRQRAVRRMIGVVFQNPSVDRHLTVRENMIHQGHLYGLRGQALHARIDELLDLFDLADRSSDRAATLSGGLRRRVEIAKSMLHAPEMLILDEPSTGLDPHARDEMIRVLKTLRDRSGVTSLITTHLMEEADQCNLVGILSEGHLVALDAPDTLKSAVGGDVVTLTTSDAAALATRITQQFEVPCAVSGSEIRIELEDGHRFVPRVLQAFPDAVDRISVGKATLSDAYFHFTGKKLAPWEAPP
ncbi:MAG: ABC transporter ATP-binding protein [Phycisphaerae bacterium]